MTKDALLNKLTAKLLKYTSDFETLQSNTQARNLAFGSAGNLSRASYNKLSRHRDKLGDICTLIKLTELSIKIVSGEVFSLGDLQWVALSFLGNRNPEYIGCLSSGMFKLKDVNDMFQLIYSVHRYAYRKEILAYGLVYVNLHGATLNISLC